MPVPSATRYPLESFDPRLKDIWLTAVRQPVELQFSTAKQAIRFQHRLQQYRAALKRVDPEAARLLYRAKCSRSGNALLVTKQDEEFSEVLNQISEQLLVRSPELSEVPEELPVGPAETPIPPSSVEAPAVSFDELFSDIPVRHIPEGEDE